ncbi:MFS general substrate transporter [Coemansia reversa NRRL 1564]|uniref:MFS general substrate transporter n=1 Tax=Coemansia reversa (strain ATCC 12441 / NRRL 1564) TaxID=763665 RepID=A0A2G5BAG2_COERN|nr:MFS general substrate transporter [Coemansia reversa NRRL 1564]|eukprot:PIA15982.1 MFS general substrate transporter [Coemansia reversa NRRL 1564]
MRSKRFRRQSLQTYPQGMGTLVVFCSFMALSLGPGLLNAYGVFEEEYDRLYDNKDDRDKTSGSLDSPVIFIGVIQIFLANGMGFIGGHCAQRFGPGPSVFAGGILMAIGLLSASYSHKVWQLCLTQGLLFGLGVCLTWIPAASAPSSWFEKNRGLATGITHMGLGIGGLIFSPLSRFLLEKFGTAGALRWLALITLIVVAIASMGIHSKHHDQPVNDIVIGSVRWSRCLDDKGIAFENGYNSDSISYEEYRQASPLSHARASSQISRKSEKHLSVSMKDGNQIEPCNLDKILNQDWHNGSKEIGIESPDDDILPAVPKHVRFASEFARQATLKKLEGISGKKPRVRDSEKIPAQRRRQRLEIGDKNVTSFDTIKASNNISFAEKQKSLLKSWRFWLLSLGIGVGQASWYIVLLFMTSISISVGIDVHNAAILLGSINGASAVGQFTAGYAADIIGPINALIIFTFLATIANIILFIPKLSFHLLLIYACLCGASIGAVDPLAVIAGVTQFGRSRAASTTGLIYGSVGVLVTIAAPNARVIQQRLGDSNNFLPIYIFIIMLFLLSTLLLVLLRLRISCKLLLRA